MACEKHGYNNPTMCPACDLEDARLAAAERRADEAGFRRGLEAAAKIVSDARFGEHDTDLRSIYHSIRAIPYTPGEQA